MTSSKKMSRSDLADAIAIDRIDYERYVLDAGYSERHFQPLLPFVKSQAFEIAKGRPVAGIQVSRNQYGVTFAARIDWAKLAASVERRLPGWREVVARMDERSGS